MKKSVIVILLFLVGCSSFDTKVTEQNKQDVWNQLVKEASKDELDLIGHYLLKKKALNEESPSSLDPVTPESQSKELIYLVGYTPRQIMELEKGEEALGITVEKVQLEQFQKYEAGRPERARTSAVKAHMYDFQTLIDTYSVDWGGEYPSDLKGFFSYITSPEVAEFYPRSRMNNPYDLNQFIQFNAVEMDDGTKCPRGAVLYRPVIKDGKVISYFISGCNLDGKIKQKNGLAFTLTNSR